MYANDTDKIAFAPRLVLFLVLSNFISNSSNSLKFLKSLFIIFSFIIVLTLFTAFNTPFPRYLFSLSRNSNASFEPVEAPLGMLALPIMFPSIVISVSTVGHPLESNISLEMTFIIFISSPILVNII